MYELKKKFGNLFTSKFVGTEPSSDEKRIYWAAVSQSLRNIGLSLFKYISHEIAWTVRGKEEK